MRIALIPACCIAATSRSAIVDFPEPSIPSKAMNAPGKNSARAAARNFHSAVWLPAPASRGERVSFGELVLHLANAGHLGCELNRWPAVDHRRDCLLRLRDRRKERIV